MMQLSMLLELGVLIQQVLESRLFGQLHLCLFCYLITQTDEMCSFVNEVRVTGEQVLVNYTIPVSPPKLKEEKNPVLDIVHDGGPLWTRTTDPGLIRTVL